MQNVRQFGVWMRSLLSCATQDVHILRSFFGNLHGFPWICTHFVRNNKANNRSDRYQISHSILPNESNSTSTVDCMWSSVAIQIQVEAAVDFLSKLALKVTENIRLKIQEDIQTAPIGVTTSASHVAEKKQFFLHKQTRRRSQKNIKDVKTIAKVIINIMTKHAYLPTTLISDKGLAFPSHAIK